MAKEIADTGRIGHIQSFNHPKFNIAKMEALCTDDTGKPNEIQQKNWIRKGQTYTVVKLYTNPLSGEHYFALEEVQPDSPYGGYKVERFSFDINDLTKLLEGKKEEITEEEPAMA